MTRPTTTVGADLDAPRQADELHWIDGGREADAAAPPMPADSLRSSATAPKRVRELTAATERLQHQLLQHARRLQSIMLRLAGVAQRGGAEPIAGVIRDAAAPRADPASLSAREREVLHLLTEGLRSPCIAQRLGIRNATVEVHRRNIMRKLDLHSIAALTKYAIREGLTSL